MTAYSKAEEIAHNARIADNAEVFWGWATQAGQVRVRRRIQLVGQSARLEKGINALELGCGTGMFTQYFVHTGADICAVDLSENFVDKARSKPGLSQQKFCVCDAERLCFADNSFDAVFGISILHHLKAGLALSEIRRVLKHNGRIAFTEPNMLNPQIMLQKNLPPLKRWLGDSPDETAFLRWRLKALLETSGFQNISVEPFDFIHPFFPSAALPAVKIIGELLERIPGVREIAGSLLISASLQKAEG